jgi:hypothetical protein
MGSNSRLYNESLFVAREIRELLQNWNWGFRRCKRIFGEERESENGSTTEYNGEYESENWAQLPVGDSHGKLGVEEEFEVSLWTLSVCGQKI